MCEVIAKCSANTEHMEEGLMKDLDKIPLEVGWKVKMGSLAESSAEEWTSCDALGKKKKP